VTSDPDAPCYLNLTSGSTGRPRAAATTQRQIVANAIVTADGLGVRDEDVFLGMFSVFAHPHELFHRSLLDGSAFVIVDSLHPRVLADAIRRWGVTWIMAVPSFYEMLLDHVLATGRPLDSLRVLEAGGAWVGPEAQRRLADGFHATFVSVWGSTETTGVALAAVPGPTGEPPPPGCTGRALEGYHARVVRDDGTPAPPGEVGELVVAGPAVTRGYVDHPDATAAQFRPDGYWTRDLVRQDEAGWFWFAGRRDDMLKIGGVRVYPLAVEQVIAAHPEVRGVLVVRDEDRVRGEVARAVLETTPGSTLDRRGVQAWCRERLPPYAVPRIVEFWGALPRLPNGKPDRRAVVTRPADPSRDERAP
jgi:long-chain acyl-CoA synthetase